MSLRYQINLRIFLSSLCIVLLGGSIAIWQARNAVDKEIHSSINLAVQLISFGLSHSGFNEADWLARFNSLKETRHLSIQLQEPSGHIVKLLNSNTPIRQEPPPQWFIALVGGNAHRHSEQVVTRFDGQAFTLLIQANPLDEITEVWQESLAFFGSLILLVLLTFLAVHLAFNKALKAITLIVDSLKIIETGHYRQQLPAFASQEFASIANAINHMTAELAAAQQANRALTQHSLAIQEEERQHLAQELHDELGQSLTAIKVMAAVAANNPAQIQQSTELISNVSDHLLTVVRSMMRQLHPLVLTELGLKAALEDLLNHWSLRNPELKLMLNCPDEVDTLAQTIAIQVFRIVQEGLTNIVRHAQADQAQVSLQVDADNKRLLVQISDNGQGCVEANLKAGFGLLGMCERVNSLGGEFNIHSQAQQGLSLNASIPL
jgi:two-component system sensor histidine kinase UhpB